MKIIPNKKLINELLNEKYFIHVANEYESKMLQEYLFSIGYVWMCGENYYLKYIKAHVPGMYIGITNNSFLGGRIACKSNMDNPDKRIIIEFKNIRFK